MTHHHGMRCILQKLYGDVPPAELVEHMLTELRHLSDERGVNWEKAVRKSAQYWQNERGDTK